MQAPQQQQDSSRVQITHMDDPFAIIASMWGLVDNMAWSRREADRIAAKGIRVYVKQNGGDRIAVYRGDPQRDCGVIYAPAVF